jgi:hypothetical protein
MKLLWVALVFFVIGTSCGKGPAPHRVVFLWEGVECIGPSFYDGEFPVTLELICNNPDKFYAVVGFWYKDKEDVDRCGFTRSGVTYKVTCK